MPVTSIASRCGTWRGEPGDGRFPLKGRTRRRRSRSGRLSSSTPPAATELSLRRWARATHLPPDFLRRNPFSLTSRASGASRNCPTSRRPSRRPTPSTTPPSTTSSPAAGSGSSASRTGSRAPASPPPSRSRATSCSTRGRPPGTACSPAFRASRRSSPERGRCFPSSTRPGSASAAPARRATAGRCCPRPPRSADPLLSTGFPLALLGIQRLGPRARRGLGHAPIRRAGPRVRRDDSRGSRRGRATRRRALRGARRLSALRRAREALLRRRELLGGREAPREGAPREFLPALGRIPSTGPPCAGSARRRGRR